MSVEVCGFVLPDEIAALADDERWTAYTEQERLPTVVIGELGYDRPFGLDFRSEHPVVRFMTVEGLWVVIAASAAAFVDALGIEGGCS